MGFVKMNMFLAQCDDCGRINERLMSGGQEDGSPLIPIGWFYDAENRLVCRRCVAMASNLQDALLERDRLREGEG